PLHDRRLLRVLLAEIRPVGADDVEQLQADRRDAAEVAGAELPFERVAEALWLDPRLEPRRVEPLHGRREQDVDARPLSASGGAPAAAKRSVATRWRVTR